jgi:hypothetical protein
MAPFYGRHGRWFYARGGAKLSLGLAQPGVNEEAAQSTAGAGTSRKLLSTTSMSSRAADPNG